MKKEIVWPHGHQAAAMICIMLDAEFIWLGMDPEKYDTPKHRSMGEYGPRRGINRILEALDRFQVKATFFAPGIFAETYPEQLKEIAEAGHEIALHGYRHEDFGGLSKEQQQSVLNRGAKAIEQTIGRMPVGFRLPEGGCTEETLTLIQQAGFLYDNSFFDLVRAPSSEISRHPAARRASDVLVKRSTGARARRLPQGRKPSNPNIID